MRRRLILSMCVCLMEMVSPALIMVKVVDQQQLGLPESALIRSGMHVFGFLFSSIRTLGGAK